LAFFLSYQIFFSEYILSPFRFGPVIRSMLRRHLFSDSYY
jgi:hypothetical protein